MHETKTAVNPTLPSARRQHQRKQTPPSPKKHFEIPFREIILPAPKMPYQELLVRLYELSGEPPGSPYCWPIRFALNFKGIPFTVSKLSFPPSGQHARSSSLVWKASRSLFQSSRFWDQLQGFERLNAHRGVLE